MAYKTPIVCKEVYLPVDVTFGQSESKQDYKEKYGIDLDEIFSVNTTNPNDFSVTPKPFTKIFLVRIGNYDNVPSVGIPTFLMGEGKVDLIVQNNNGDGYFLQFRLDDGDYLLTESGV